jgi:hypothetical protein
LERRPGFLPGHIRGESIIHSTNYRLTNIERDGFWILIKGQEFFVPFDRYPAFKQANIDQIFNFHGDDQDINWPQLDVDIEVDALKHPENYPLIFQ